MDKLNEIAKRYAVLESTDKSEFRRKARILQSVWRSDQGYPMGSHPKCGLLGSRLAMPQAEQELLNFLTLNIRQVVRNEVLDKQKSKDKMYARPRIFNDLLSSQPLCFNLFAELQLDPDLATSVFKELLPATVKKVTRIEFEHSPGRRQPKYTGDRTAFDVYVEFETLSRDMGFIGIEVKYHENLQGKPAPHRSRYDEIARHMNCFKQDCSGQLQQEPLQQLWRNHLLAGALREVNGFSQGLFVFLYPRDNAHCSQAAALYHRCLTNSETFMDWTMETVTAVIKKHTAATWVDAFVDRYLDFEKIEKTKRTP